METNERALELYAEGKSVNSVAKALMIPWAAAKKLQPQPPRKDRKPPTRKEEPAEDYRWELGIKVPLERAVGIFAEFTLEEKIYLFSELKPQQQMDAILDVLQRRMDAVCAPPVTVEQPMGKERAE